MMIHILYAQYSYFKHCHKLEGIVKITAKKKYPVVITFKFGTGVGETIVITHVLRFS